jgi:hypothetical protein
VKRPSLLLKIAVVSSSLLLAAGFVSYRAGVLDRLLDRKVASVNAAQAHSEQGAAEGSQPNTQAILGGTNSGSGQANFTELNSSSVESQPSSEPSPSPRDLRMSSSKSIKLQMWNPSQPTNPAP